MWTAVFTCAACSLLAPALAATVGINADRVFVIDGRPVFPIGFTKAPPPDGKTPSGQDAYAALETNGAVFHRCRGPGAEFDRLLERSAATGLLCAAYLPDLSAPGPQELQKEEELRRVVGRYRTHPGLGYWKGADEPEWGKLPVANVKRFYDIVHALDPHHPVWITQAPRGTIESLKAYDPAYDVVAIDIYPIGYPPGAHSHLPNKEISVVGDYADWLEQISGGEKPFWMVLQIAWSGVVKPGKTLRFPTFPEERYMSYQAIIHGARGLLYFGGDVQPALNARDRALGWNWTFYDRVLHPLLNEFNPSSPLYPALIAPDSRLPVKAEGVELRAREAGGHIFVLAARREGETSPIRFTGLPSGVTSGDVLFEEPRTVQVSGGAFTDWFGPHEVHVYRFARHAGGLPH